MIFTDRKKELSRLDTGRASGNGSLTILWGRRRVGKTRLLLEWLHKGQGIYFSADQSPPPLQRRYLAQTAAEVFPGFSDVEYPDWRSLLARLLAEAVHQQWQGTLVLDEFPYLIEADRSLESVLQNWVDSQLPKTGIHLVLSGSSQRMMQGLVLDHAAPLYGRASEILKIDPIPIGFMPEALSVSSPLDTVKAYTCWGGIPRYWELAVPYGNDLDTAVHDLVLDPLGPLHDECERLLREDELNIQLLRPILDVVGNGCHRVSEIGGPLGIPATSLTRPLKLLCELGYLKREVPFGESEAKTKRSLYKIDDPFLACWSKVVAPNRSGLRSLPESSRRAVWARYRDSLFADRWEGLCRAYVPVFRPGGPWLGASRFWQGNSPEFDVVAASLDKQRLLLGEAKWSEKPYSLEEIRSIIFGLKAKGLPRSLEGRYREILHVIFVPVKAQDVPDQVDGCFIVTAEDIVRS